MKIPAKYRRKAVLNDHLRSWTINWRLLEGENTFQFYEDAVLKRNVSNKFDQKLQKSKKKPKSPIFLRFSNAIIGPYWHWGSLDKGQTTVSVDTCQCSLRVNKRNLSWCQCVQCYNGDQLKTCDLFPCTHIKLMMRRASFSKKKKNARHPVPGCALH